MSGGRPTGARLLKCSIYLQLLSCDALMDCLQAASERAVSLVEVRMRWQHLHAARGVVCCSLVPLMRAPQYARQTRRARQTTAFERFEPRGLFCDQIDCNSVGPLCISDDLG